MFGYGTLVLHRIGSDSPKHNVAKREASGPRELFGDAAALALAGGWEFDILDRTAYWSAHALRIHGIEEGARLALGRGSSQAARTKADLQAGGAN